MTRSAISDVSRQTETLRSITLWVLQIVLALMFAIAGFPKLIGVAVMVQLFEITGIGQWFRYPTRHWKSLGGFFWRWTHGLDFL